MKCRHGKIKQSRIFVNVPIALTATLGVCPCFAKQCICGAIKPEVSPIWYESVNDYCEKNDPYVMQDYLNSLNKKEE